ncbi:TniB family NTP-binding protein [Neptuniibacter sp. QD37_11]|uniref:TniB family NTP-binding protein n=1 Tax=Neptuniibacter sp. QD37_11 TaxID=3398209 RepID=UPI0039F4BAD4
MSNLILTTDSRPEASEFCNAILPHSRFEEGLMAINQVHKTLNRTCKGLLIVGPSGTGKTKLIETYADKQNGPSLGPRDAKKVVIIDVFASSSVDLLYQSILDALGDPEPAKGRTGAKFHRIQVLMKKLGVELLIFDEIHNLLPVNAGASTVKIANTIKTLMNVLKVPMILAGENDSIYLRSDHAAIAGRFPSTFKLGTLSCKPKEIERFREYMVGLHSLITVPCINLHTDEMLYRFYLATAGKSREIGELITKAIEFTPPGKAIELVHFRKSFKMVDCTPLGELDYNPFGITASRLESEMREYL